MTTSPSLDQIIEEQLRVWSERLGPATIALYRSHTRGFLRYLHRNYPEFGTPAQLQRDPHILGWLRSLEERIPPYANESRLRMIVDVRRLLIDLADGGHPIALNLIVRRDIPYPPKPVCHEVDNLLGQLIKQQIKTLSVTLRPSTVARYRAYAKGFLRYLHRNYPELETPAQLQRDPHILGWLRSLAGRIPPYANSSRLHMIVDMRRLLIDLADGGHPIAVNLILPRDLPPKDLYLPKPLSPEADNLLREELRKTDDLLSNALLLIRATGMRLGECLGLKRDCLHHLGGDHWALHVPLGKLHNERLVPMDEEARRVLDRILSLTGPSNDPTSLLFMMKEKTLLPQKIRKALKKTSIRLGCHPVCPHQLRHTYATSILRAGISLPALKEILGHRDIKMTLRYVQVTQTDLQREYLLARQKMATLHALPQLPGAPRAEKTGEIPAICTSLDAIRHQLEMYRRQLSDQNADRKVRTLLKRLVRLRTSLSTFLKT